jgi:hypothetical protein
MIPKDRLENNINPELGMSQAKKATLRKATPRRKRDLRQKLKRMGNALRSYATDSPHQ